MTQALSALLPAGLALLMLSVGLRLSILDLATTLRRPRALVAGLTVQIAVLPCAAVLIAGIFRLPPEMAAGLILVAAAPGGVTSNYICVLARGDLALSAAMTLCTTLLCSLTIPAVLLIADTGIALTPQSLLRISLSMAGIALVPLLVGLALNTYAPLWSQALRRGLDPAARLIFLAIVAATLVGNWPEITANIRQIGPAGFALNLCAILAGAVAGVLFRLRRRQRRAIMVEASLQNVAVPIFLANGILQAPELAIPGLVYVFAMNISALAQIGWAAVRDDRQGQTASPS